jgi:isocitrate dehydrogenase kinase/phosphatase
VKKNIFLLVNEKNLSSDEIQEKTCQLIAKSRIHHDCLLMSSDVFSTQILSSDAIANTDEQNSADNQGLASLLRRALNKLANSQEYNSIVEDIHAFVNAFNERIPEYKMRFGQQMVLDNAKKLKARGWK